VPRRAFHGVRDPTPVDTDRAHLVVAERRRRGKRFRSNRVAQRLVVLLGPGPLRRAEGVRRLSRRAAGRPLGLLEPPRRAALRIAAAPSRLLLEGSRARTPHSQYGWDHLCLLFVA